MNKKKKVMFNRHIIGSIFFLLFVVAGAPVTAAYSYSYSIMHLSDTQQLSESYPETLNYTFSYLESQKNVFNISAIIITGDLVSDGDDTNQWMHYTEARSRTTIPVYEIPGNHDLNGDSPLFDEFIGNNSSWTTVINDFIFIGLGYSKNSLSEADIAYYRSFIEGNPQKFTLVAVHNYYNKDYTVSPLGESIRDNLVLKPTIVMSGHVHASFIRSGFVRDLPFIVDLTDYQDYGDFSAGELYTVYVTDGNVTSIAVQEVYIYPTQFYHPQRTIYQAPVEFWAPDIYPPQPPGVNPDASPSAYPTKSPMIYSVGSLPLSPEKASIVYPNRSPGSSLTIPITNYLESSTGYPRKSSMVYSVGSKLSFPGISSITYLTDYKIVKSSDSLQINTIDGYGSFYSASMYQSDLLRISSLQ